MNQIRIRVVGGFLWAAFSAAPLAATNYYISDCRVWSESGTPQPDAQCQPGNDANPGTSPSAPWRTFGKFSQVFGTLQAGDSIRFARGGTFAASDTTIFNANSRASNPIVVEDYTPTWATGDEGRPVLFNPNGGMFAISDSGGPTHDEGYVFRNLVIRGWSGLPGQGTSGFFIYNDADDVIIENLVIDGFGLGVYIDGYNDMGGPFAFNPFSERLIVRKCEIMNNRGQGYLGASLNGVIENNYFHNNGWGEAVRNHNIYLSGANGMRVSGNTLYQSAMVDGVCQGVSLVGHGGLDDLVIENNLIYEDFGKAAPTCYGIAIDNGYPGTPERFQRLVIRGNTVVNVGNIGIGASVCLDCLIENNVIIQEHGGITGISIPDRNEGTEDYHTTNATVRNNSIYIANAPQSVGISVRRATNNGTNYGDSHVVVGNVIRYTGTGGMSCFYNDLDVSAYEAMDNNICSPGTGWEAVWQGDGLVSLANWRATTPFDDNSLQADPMFLSPAAPDHNLELRPGSPAIGLGHPSLGAPLDYLSRPRDGDPDAGAYEFAGSVVDLMPPAAPRKLRGY